MDIKSLKFDDRNNNKHTEKGNIRSYKRYIGIALTFYEISPVTVKQE